MPKILSLIIFLVLIARVGFSQKNFEGEIDYKTYRLDDQKSDTTFGKTLKVLIGHNAIKIETLVHGAVFEDKILLIDSLKVIDIHHDSKSYWKSTYSNKPGKAIYFIPWGMDKAEAIDTLQQKVAGYDTYFTRYTNSDKNRNFGFVDLYTAKNLFFNLSREEHNLMFIDDASFFYHNNIVLETKLCLTIGHHKQTGYIATKVVHKEIDLSAFQIPVGCTLMKTTVLDLMGAKVESH